MADEIILTTCPRDCYDACAIEMSKRGGAIRRVRSDRNHLVSRATSGVSGGTTPGVGSDHGPGRGVRDRGGLLHAFIVLPIVRLAATSSPASDPQAADQLDPGLLTRPGRHLDLVPLAATAPVPGPAVSLPGTRLRAHVHDLVL